MNTRTRYQCDVCHSIYSTAKDARKCEKRHPKVGSTWYMLFARFGLEPDESCKKCHGTGKIRFISPQGNALVESCDCRNRYADGVIVPVTITKIRYEEDYHWYDVVYEMDSPLKEGPRNFSSGHVVTDMERVKSSAKGFGFVICRTRKLAKAALDEHRRVNTYGIDDGNGGIWYDKKA